MPFGVYLWGHHVATYSDDFKECHMARDRQTRTENAQTTGEQAEVSQPTPPGQGELPPGASAPGPLVSNAGTPPTPAKKRPAAHPNIQLLARLDKMLQEVSPEQRNASIEYLYHMYGCGKEQP